MYDVLLETLQVQFEVELRGIKSLFTLSLFMSDNKKQKIKNN